MTTLTSEPALAHESDNASSTGSSDIPTATAPVAPTPAATGDLSSRERRDAGIAERRARRAHEHATRNRRHDAAAWTTLVAGLAISVGLVGVIAYDNSMAQQRDTGAITSTS